VLPAALAFAAGAMVWIVARQLVPEALEHARPGNVAATLAACFAAMTTFQLALL
jgi:ZIP family zinc transporter